MAYFESSKLKNIAGNNINPAEDDSLTLLRSIFRLLKPLGFITGAGSNRLSVDINNISGTANFGPVLSSSTLGSVSSVSSVSSVTTVSTVSTVTNIPTIGNHNAFDLMKSMSRTAYNTGIRSNLT